MADTTPHLALECRHGRIEVAIRLGIPAHPDRESDRQPVALRFDAERLISETLALSANGQALEFPYPVATVGKLSEHETLSVRLDHVQLSPQWISFDLTGLDRAVLPLREACDGEFSHPTEVMSSGGAGPPMIPDSYVEPAYPARALRDEIRAQVILRLQTRIDGELDRVEVWRSSHPGYGFEEAATEAAWQWRYEPATWRGQPVAARFAALIHFRPPDSIGTTSPENP